jgi:hypothetical protein
LVVAQWNVLVPVRFQRILIVGDNYSGRSIAQSLNGLTAFGSGSVLAADDGSATVWKVNVATGAAQAWLTGGLLEPNNPDLPIGPNGVKIFNNMVYITNTGAGR